MDEFMGCVTALATLVLLFFVCTGVITDGWRAQKEVSTCEEKLPRIQNCSITAQPMETSQ